jgi:uncharacterized repeat protein (TIGR03803 family)
MVAGCGGGSTPLSSPAGVAAERTHVRPAYSLLYSFKRGNDGRDPHAGPLIKVKGTLYGTTVYGGGPCHGRCFGGTVFAITTSGGETVLHSLEVGSKDGKNPRAGLIHVTGTLYGTTIHGGAASCYCGTVFKVTLSGAEAVLYSFSGAPDGSGPDAGLLNVNGTLYGTTFFGGTAGEGTVFAITTSGGETVLHSFAGTPDGAQPYAGLINVNGTLYGTTTLGGANCGSGFGCGTVFSITTGGSENVLHSFGNGTDGKFPTAGLINVSGTLYGTTEGGGSYAVFACRGFAGCGTVFSITTGGSENVLHSFNGTDGRLPTAGLVNVRGTLYGATSSGGRKGQDFGVLFSVSGSGTEKVLHSFNSGGHRRGGATNPNGLINVRGSLYGTASRRGQFGGGAVFVQTL